MFIARKTREIRSLNFMCSQEIYTLPPDLYIPLTAPGGSCQGLSPTARLMGRKHGYRLSCKESSKNKLRYKFDYLQRKVLQKGITAKNSKEIAKRKMSQEVKVITGS